MPVLLTSDVTDADADELWPVYDEVFADQPDRETWRTGVWGRHAARPGFRLAVSTPGKGGR